MYFSTSYANLLRHAAPYINIPVIETYIYLGHAVERRGGGNWEKEGIVRFDM